MIRLNPGLMARSTNRRRYIDSGTNYPLSSIRTRKDLSDISAEGAANAPASRSFLNGPSSHQSSVKIGGMGREKSGSISPPGYSRSKLGWKPAR
ncbi:hypothetical protein TNCV_5048031 [Trichonephila clavipes]|nr:hypothetical protein TNCV_5048031 [Trichonephila clavipes]